MQINIWKDLMRWIVWSFFIVPDFTFTNFEIPAVTPRFTCIFFWTIIVFPARRDLFFSKFYCLHFELDRNCSVFTFTVQAILNLRNPNLSFLNQTMFDFRKLYEVNIKDGSRKQMSYSLSKCFKYLNTIWKNLAMFQKTIG